MTHSITSPPGSDNIPFGARRRQNAVLEPDSEGLSIWKDLPKPYCKLFRGHGHRKVWLSVDDRRFEP